MLAVLEFVFTDVWHFLGCVVFMMIIALWHPVEIVIAKDEKGGNK